MLPAGHHFDEEGPDVYNIWLMVKTILRPEKLDYEWHISDLLFAESLRLLIIPAHASITSCSLMFRFEVSQRCRSLNISQGGYSLLGCSLPQGRLNSSYL